jgi:hypothetical protein
LQKRGPIKKPFPERAAYFGRIISVMSLIPYAGITQIRFKGYNLRPMPPPLLIFKYLNDF